MKISKPRTTKGTALFAALVAESKIANDVVIADLTGIEFAPTDYFVFCSCDSESQMQAIVNEVRNLCTEYQMDKPKIEGLENAYWVIVDFFDVVFHVMHKDARSFYQIEKIWGDAKFYSVGASNQFKAFKDFSYLS